MTRNWYIDDRDIFSDFGVIITEGGYNGLLVFPSMKTPDTMDWPEEDGIEVDLTNPTLTIKDVSINFLCRGEHEVCDFIAFISKPGYRVLRVTSLGREWRLRLTSQTSNNVYNNCTPFVLTFTDDFPCRSEKLEAPGSGVLLPICDYEIDDVPVEQYGVYFNEGLEELLKSPTIKKNLNRSISTQDGAIYDADMVRFNSKEVTFGSCFMADSTERFWRCYDAFFNTLIQREERSLYVGYIGKEYPCYYKSSSDFEIVSMGDRFICNFNLTLVFTVYRIEETEYILGTENDFFITTEDDEFIDMEVRA